MHEQKLDGILKSRLSSENQETKTGSPGWDCDSWHSATVFKMTATSSQSLTFKYAHKKISGSSQFSDKGNKEQYGT